MMNTKTFENTTRTSTDNMSNMVTQTQLSTQVEDQNGDEFVPSLLHQGTTDELDIKMEQIPKVFDNKPMIELTLDGRKAVIKHARKSIPVKRHYRNKKRTNIKLKIKDESGKSRLINDPEYQLSLKLMNKIRFEELMELRERVFK
jgi:hypothetical protein